ncbi:MAG: hypothetical protein K2J59_07290, partial [Eubacterium sp.]|nr:hypothetical protein [Eubacterium sp.]
MSKDIRLDIVPLGKDYRGIERAFSADQFVFIKNKKKFNILLEMYYDYLDYTFNKTFNIDEFFYMIQS